MIYVIATSDVKEECFDEFLSILKTNSERVRKEKGCIFYQPTVDFDAGLPNQKPVSKSLVTILECWESQEDLKNHLAAPHMSVYREATKDMVKSKTLNVVEPA